MDNYIEMNDTDLWRSVSTDSFVSCSSTRQILGRESRESRKRNKFNINFKLLFAITAAVLGSSFQHGYNTGVTNIPQLLIQDFINDTCYERNKIPCSESKVTLIFSTLVSIFCVGGIIGALMTAFVTERFGRRNGLLLNNMFAVSAAVLMYTSKTAMSYEMFIIGRVFAGINAGLNAGLVPMYLTEISPLSLRGAVGTLYQLGITISILISQVLGLPQILGTVENWPFLFAVTILPSLFQLCTLPFCPESPVFLIKQENDASAQKALTWLRGTDEVLEELHDLKAEYEYAEMIPKVRLLTMIVIPRFSSPLSIAVMVMLSQQLSGINAVIFYSTDIFLKAGLSEENALCSTLGMGSINVVMTLVSMALVDRLGRRTLYLFGLGGMMILTVLLTMCLTLQKVTVWFSYCSIFCVIVFVIMYAVGPGPIPWFLVSEMFGQEARPMASTIAVTVNWIANFIVSLSFLPIENFLGRYTFFLFTALLTKFWIYTYKRLPETKKKTAEDIRVLYQVRRPRQ